MSNSNNPAIIRPPMNKFNSWDSIDQRVIQQMEMEQTARRKSSAASATPSSKSKGKMRDPDFYDQIDPKSTFPSNSHVPPIPRVPANYKDFITKINESGPPISRVSTLNHSEILELKEHLSAIDRDRTRDLESQVRIQTQQYRMGWRSVLQIGSAFVSTATLAIAISNLVNRIATQAKMSH